MFWDFRSATKFRLKGRIVQPESVRIIPITSMFRHELHQVAVHSTIVSLNPLLSMESNMCVQWPFSESSPYCYQFFHNFCVVLSIFCIFFRWNYVLFLIYQEIRWNHFCDETRCIAWSCPESLFRVHSHTSVLSWNGAAYKSVEQATSATSNLRQ